MMQVRFEAVETYPGELAERYDEIAKALTDQLHARVHPAEDEGPSPFLAIRETEALVEETARNQFDRMIRDVQRILERPR